MNKIINLLVSDHIFALFAFGFIFILLSIFMYLVFYIYLNINLRGVCKIIFNNARQARRMLIACSATACCAI
ncbi:hypothetical protein B1201_15660 [Acinetobacter sp. ANC 5600]|nr:hypothetical protein B1201_15660 [Acinetobacter sp. ANC 5600]